MVFPIFSSSLIRSFALCLGLLGLGFILTSAMQVPAQAGDALPADFVEAMKAPADGSTTFYSLDPEKKTDRSLYQEWIGEEPPKFHDFYVLGKVDLKADAAAIACREIEKVTLKNLGPQVDPCFLPRHGVRIQTCDNRYDFVICYQCGKYALYRNDTLLGSYEIDGPPDVMNKLVKKNGLTLAK
ncbi:MAG: hypothetical protein ACAI35_03310 [Candidatus Methylacidiphilales bacterium]